MACWSLGQNQYSVRHMYTTGQSPPVNLIDLDPSVGLTNQTCKFSSGILSCSFNRIKSRNNVTNYFDLSNNNSFYLLAAQGSISNSKLKYHDWIVPSIFFFKDQLQYHFSNRIYSLSQINFEMVSDTLLDFTDTSSPLDKAHGLRDNYVFDDNHNKLFIIYLQHVWW